MKNRSYLFVSLLLIATFLIKPIFSEPTPYILATQQKAGSHLLMKLLGMLHGERRPEYFYHLDETNFHPSMLEESWKKGNNPYVHLFKPQKTHQYFYNHHHNFKVITILRDIRDAYVSYAHMIAKDPTLTEKEKIDNTMNKGGYYRMSYDLSLFLDDPRFYVIRFEDLVGPRGGGDKKRQTHTIYNLAAYIGMPISYAKASKLGDDLFGGKTMTFRKGQIGSWKKACNAEQKRWLKEHFSTELIRLGYEEGYDW